MTHEEQNGLVEALRFAKRAIEDAEEELRLIRMKDCGAVYNPILRAATLPLAIQKIDATLSQHVAQPDQDPITIANTIGTEIRRRNRVGKEGEKGVIKESCEGAASDLVIASLLACGFDIVKRGSAAALSQPQAQAVKAGVDAIEQIATILLGSVNAPEQEIYRVSREIVALSQPEAQGWIVGSGDGMRWRTWSSGSPEWTVDRDKATRFSRREDAEAVHREDEEAWTVVQFASQPETQAVPVKKLEWSHAGKVPDGPWSETRLHQVRGHHNLGRYAGSYTVQEMEAGGKWGWWNTWTSDREPEGVEATEDEAKAAAQADFDRRIRSVLSQPEAQATFVERTPLRESIAAVMFQTGTPDQQIEALTYAHGKLPATRPAEVQAVPAALSPLPWKYCHHCTGTLGACDWIEDANGNVVVENIGSIDGPFIVSRINAASPATGGAR